MISRHMVQRRICSLTDEDFASQIFTNDAGNAILVKTYPCSRGLFSLNIILEMAKGK